MCVNAQNGCGTSIFKCVGVSVSACRLGNFDTNGNNADEPEPNVISVTPIRIYPNPIISGNELVIEWDADIESNPNEIKIFDLTGKCVVNIKNPLNEENRTRITGLTTGIYLIQIHSKSDVYNHKLVVD